MKPIILTLALAALSSHGFAQSSGGGDSATLTVSKPPRTEERLVGENEQPEWTTSRRFPGTRVYVLPPWQVEAEQWWRGKFPREGRAEHLFQEELGIGLPWRFQLDLYTNIEHTPEHGTRHKGEQVELRWAFAKWGHIPLNPALYAEWKSNEQAADAYEFKLLLGDTLARRWHWGLNVSYEQETGGARATEWAVSQAISYTLFDERLSVGIEAQWERTTERGARGDPEDEFLIGPSIQWRPTPRTHLDIAPLFGTTKHSPRMEAFAIFGIDLGPGDNKQEVIAPISTRSR